MSKYRVGLTALSIGLLALAFYPSLPPTRPAKVVRKLPRVTLPRVTLPQVTLSRDLPVFGLVKSAVYAVDPDALIYLGDPVVVRSAESLFRIEAYTDDLMGCVVGLVLA